MMSKEESHGIQVKGYSYSLYIQGELFPLHSSYVAVTSQARLSLVLEVARAASPVAQHHPDI